MKTMLQLEPPAGVGLAGDGLAVANGMVQGIAIPVIAIPVAFFDERRYAMQQA